MYHTIEKYASFLSGFNQVFIIFFSGTVPLSGAMLVCMQQKERKRGRKHYPIWAQEGIYKRAVMHLSYKTYSRNLSPGPTLSKGISLLSLFYANT